MLKISHLPVLLILATSIGHADESSRPSLMAAAGQLMANQALNRSSVITISQDGNPPSVENGIMLMRVTANSFGGMLENQKTGVSWKFQFASNAQVTNWAATKNGAGLTVTGTSSTLGACSLQISALAPGILTLNWKAEKNWKQIDIELQNDAKVFGGGERFCPSPQLNNTAVNPSLWPMRPLDSVERKAQTGMSYCVTPWMFTPMGLGLFVDSFSVKSFDFSTPDRVQIFMESSACTVDVMAAETPKELLGQYTGITGRMALAPDWAYGVWANINNGRKNALDTLDFLRRNDVPVSAVWIFDCKEPEQQPFLGWWAWAKGVYGDVPSLTQTIRSYGCKPLAYLLTANWHRSFEDPAAVSDWKEWLRKLLVEDGWNGWMEDFGEGDPANTLAYHKVTHEIALKYRPDKVTFCRSGYAGSQAFTQILWAGDQQEDWSAEGFPSTLPAALSAGMSGFTTWTSDILESPSFELFQRWVEFDTFSCVMREHQWEFKHRFHSTTDWRTLEHFRRYARIHNSLVPYLIAQVKEAADSGVPVMRHLLLEFPNDPKCQDINDQYMFGNDLMVAPVFKEGSVARDVYLPAGQWYDFWTMAPFEGGETITVPAPADHIPVFVKAGTILPMYSDTIQTLAADLAGGTWKTPGDHLILRIFPGSPGKGETSLADGSHVSVDQDGLVYTVEVSSPQEREWEFEFNVPVNLDSLKIMGAQMRTAPQSSIGFSSDVTVKGSHFSMTAAVN